MPHALHSVFGKMSTTDKMEIGVDLLPSARRRAAGRIHSKSKYSLMTARPKCRNRVIARAILWPSIDFRSIRNSPKTVFFVDTVHFGCGSRSPNQVKMNQHTHTLPSIHSRYTAASALNPNFHTLAHISHNSHANLINSLVNGIRTKCFARCSTDAFYAICGAWNMFLRKMKLLAIRQCLCPSSFSKRHLASPSHADRHFRMAKCVFECIFPSIDKQTDIGQDLSSFIRLICSIPVHIRKHVWFE